MKFFLSILLFFQFSLLAIKKVPSIPDLISLTELVISDEMHSLDIQNLTEKNVGLQEPINYNSTTEQNTRKNLSCYSCRSFQKWCADDDDLKLIGKAAIVEDCAQCFYIFGSKNHELDIESANKKS